MQLRSHRDSQNFRKKIHNKKLAAKKLIMSKMTFNKKIMPDIKKVYTWLKIDDIYGDWRSEKSIRSQNATHTKIQSCKYRLD